jgi:hypothetical protein
VLEGERQLLIDWLMECDYPNLKIRYLLIFLQAATVVVVVVVVVVVERQGAERVEYEGEMCSNRGIAVAGSDEHDDDGDLSKAKENVMVLVVGAVIVVVTPAAAALNYIHIDIDAPNNAHLLQRSFSHLHN